MKRLMFICAVIFLCSGVFASLGVDPRSYEVNFEPGLNKSFEFTFVLNDIVTDLHVEGDLANYVSLNKETISGKEKVLARLVLPSKVATPGINQIKIVAGEVVAVIKVKVPYPDKYVDLELSAPNANQGEDVGINLKVSNLGGQIVYINSSIEIYRGDELISVFDGIFGWLNVSDSLNYNISLDTSNYSVGNYSAVALVNYDGEIKRAESYFRLGTLLVRILNNSREFYENSVGRFEINVESLWNRDIDELYAEVRIIGANAVGFDTPVVKLDAWQKENIFGFLDTAGFTSQDVLANITLYYDGASSSKIVPLKILEKFDYIFYSVIFASVIIVGILLWVFFIFIRKFKK